MMERRIIKGMILGAMFLTSCYYDVEEVLYPPTNCQTSNMSLQNNIQPILDRNCYICHSTVQGIYNGNVILEGYDNLKVYVDNGKLLGSIKHASGFKQMPQNAPKLGDCDIAKTEQWILDGALNN